MQLDAKPAICIFIDGNMTIKTKQRPKSLKSKNKNPAKPEISVLHKVFIWCE